MWFGCHVMDEDSWRHFKAFCCPVAKIELFESPKKFTKSLPVYMKEFLSFICSHLGFGKNIKGANKIILEHQLVPIFALLISALFLLIHICESCQWQWRPNFEAGVEFKQLSPLGRGGCNKTREIPGIAKIPTNPGTQVDLTTKAR